MKRKFLFTWHKNERYGEPVERHNYITVTKASKDLGMACNAATELFKRSFGSLKRNTILSIQEVDENNAPLGEPLTEM